MLSTTAKVLLAQSVCQFGSKDFAPISGLLASHPLLEKDSKDFSFDAAFCEKAFVGLIKLEGWDVAQTVAPSSRSARKLAHKYYGLRVTELYSQYQSTVKQQQVLASELSSLQTSLFPSQVTADELSGASAFNSDVDDDLPPIPSTTVAILDDPQPAPAAMLMSSAPDSQVSKIEQKKEELRGDGGGDGEGREEEDADGEAEEEEEVEAVVLGDKKGKSLEAKEKLKEKQDVEMTVVPTPPQLVRPKRQEKEEFRDGDVVEETPVEDEEDAKADEDEDDEAGNFEPAPSSIVAETPSPRRAVSVAKGARGDEEEDEEEGAEDDDEVIVIKEETKRPSSRKGRSPAPASSTRKSTRGTRGRTEEVDEVEEPDEVEEDAEEEKPSVKKDSRRSHRRKTSEPAASPAPSDKGPARKRQKTEEQADEGAPSVQDLRRFKKSAMRLLEQLSDFPDAHTFMHPVLKSQAPAYDESVLRPMWIMKVNRAVRDGKLTTIEEIQRDVALIFANAVQFNGVDQEVGRHARDLWAKFETLVQLHKSSEYAN